MTTATFFKGDDEVLIVNEIILQDTKFCQHVNLPLMYCSLVSCLWCPLVFFLHAQTIGKEILKSSCHICLSCLVFSLSVFIPFFLWMLKMQQKNPLIIIISAHLHLLWWRLRYDVQGHLFWQNFSCNDEIFYVTGISQSPACCFHWHLFEFAVLIIKSLWLQFHALRVGFVNLLTYFGT